MRLAKLKLSGFKSFLEPTTLITHNNLVGIVGPNGCGKSNIIDAVTWVMGESSAKHLRGDSLTDVIFNGSGSRQSVGRASVELVFDNSEGKLGGKYASYNEISIKRQMSREGISVYFLNGSRCRRRDIKAIFLGTGLGPRSYAIIEQGVISRLIEAKPEELRTFIEEAAGVSKYRERRRETESRIKHATENIERLNDIREELSKQLSHLKRQAKAAERYQVLKQEERQLNAELLVLNWKELNECSKRDEERVRLEETRVEAGVAKLRQIESEIEKYRDGLTAANEVFNKSQSNFYQVGGEISQLEQKIQHAEERIQSFESELTKFVESLSAISAQQENDKAQLLTLSETAVSLEPELRGARSNSNKAYDALNQTEQSMQIWQKEWDACNDVIANFDREVDIDTARMEHLQSDIEDAADRALLLKQGLDSIDSESLQVQLLALNEKIKYKELSLGKKRGERERKLLKIRNLRNRSHDVNNKLASTRSAHQKLEGKISSLEALQQHEVGTDQEEIIEWLTSLQLNNAPRLVQHINIDPEWTLALETVLGYRLQDLLVDDIEDTVNAVMTFKQGTIGVSAKLNSNTEHSLDSKFDNLLNKINSDISLEPYLKGVYVSLDIEEALNIRKVFNENESVVTKDGIWLGQNWIRINRQGDDKSGVLSREQQIMLLKEEYVSLVKDIQFNEELLDKTRSALNENEQELEEIQNTLHPKQNELAGLLSTNTELKTRLEQGEARHAQLNNELKDLAAQEEIDRQDSESIRSRILRTNSDKEKMEAQKNGLCKLRDHHYRDSLEQARKQWQITHEQSHEIALQLESISSQKASLEQAIQRIDIQVKNSNARIEELNEEITSFKQPLPELHRSLEQKLLERVDAEKKLSDARNKVQTVDASLRDQEQLRVVAEQEIQELRTALENERINARETTVRLQAVVERLQKSGRKTEELLAGLDEQVEQAVWQDKVSSVERKIRKLGSINLAAIDEFNQLSERKNYLDKQNEDLTEALNTLENAMKKIDREARTRFKETFDELDTNLKGMFPVLFGGGHVYLEMTGDDLLETGVTIMAQPPGKRNSTIHLLSGGEKALIAVALVFAIFKLNPAPFCILDEVDAPLDDTNVGRFSELVTQMSSEVQFIFITHNKITMEIAQQLLGVTMHEPGVSRLVSVDIGEAVELAATA